MRRFVSSQVHGTTQVPLSCQVLRITRVISSHIAHLTFELNGDHGVICTLDNPVDLTRVKGKTIYCLDRSARPRTITFDPTQYRFKLALLKHDYEEMFTLSILLLSWGRVSLRIYNRKVIVCLE